MSRQVYALITVLHFLILCWYTLICQNSNQPHNKKNHQGLKEINLTSSSNQRIQDLCSTWFNYNFQYTYILYLQGIYFCVDIHLIPIYYRHLRSNMIAIHIQNIITKSSCTSLLSTQNNNFTWINENGKVDWHGPIMLCLLMNNMWPTTMVVIVTHKKTINYIVSENFEDKIKKMLYNMKGNYDTIQELWGAHDEYLLDIFQSLITINNREFLDLY